jgi:hypothetical protein
LSSHDYLLWNKWVCGVAAFQEKAPDPGERLAAAANAICWQAPDQAKPGQLLRTPVPVRTAFSRRFMSMEQA